MLTYVIVPTYNEGLRLKNTIEELLKTNFDIVVVDDGSIDDTESLIESYPIHYLKHQINCGQGATLKTGTEYARQCGAQAIAHFDADGQHRIEDLVKLIEHLDNNDLDIVLGSRFLDVGTNFPLQKKVILNLAKIFSNHVIGLSFSDPQSGLRVFRTSALDKLNWQRSDFLHCTEILNLIIDNKLKYQELPIIVNYDESIKKTVRPRLKMGFKILFNKLFN